MNDLFTIGEISKHQNISRQTLIFYDKIGLFRPAYVDPENGYRYYSAAQLDYLDTICIMKKFGFSLDEIKAHMKSYTLDTSLIALRKQLTIIDRQIKDLQLIKSRVTHRCAQLEQSASIHSGSAAVSVETVKSQHLLLQEVASPYTLEAVSIATKQCFVRSFKDQLPIFFQSGAIVPLSRIQEGRYTEAPSPFCRLKKAVFRVLSNCPPDGARSRTTRVTISPSGRPTSAFWSTAAAINSKSFRTPTSLRSTTIYPPATNPSTSRRSCSTSNSA